MNFSLLSFSLCNIQSYTHIHTALLITSPSGIPEWISDLEAQKLAVGICDFTCCQRNHKFGDKIVPCDRGITRAILETLIESKVQYLFKCEDILLARFFTTLRHWWLRGSNIEDVKSRSIKAMKSRLDWGDSDHEIDKFGVSLLAYVTSFIPSVSLLFHLIHTCPTTK